MRLIEIRRTGRKGRGLFATHPVPDGAVVDEAPVLTVPGGELSGTTLDAYLFEWDDTSDAVAFGALSFANHSADPNAWIEIDEETMTMRLIAGEAIASGQEITVDYGCELWFEPAE